MSVSFQGFEMVHSHLINYTPTKGGRSLHQSARLQTFVRQQEEPAASKVSSFLQSRLIRPILVQPVHHRLKKGL